MKSNLRKELREYMLSVDDLTDDERKGLYEWAEDGNSVYDNPWYYSDDRGNPMSYIETIRAVADQLAGKMGPLYIYPDEENEFNWDDGSELEF
jgi:hypothetical protein